MYFDSESLCWTYGITAHMHFVEHPLPSCPFHYLHINPLFRFCCIKEKNKQNQNIYLRGDLFKKIKIEESIVKRIKKIIIKNVPWNSETAYCEKLLNSISSLITGYSTLARPTPPLVTSTSCPSGCGALFLITQPLALSSQRSRQRHSTQTLLHLSLPKVAACAASPGHNAFARSPRTLFKMPHVAASLPLSSPFPN